MKVMQTRHRVGRALHRRGGGWVETPHDSSPEDAGPSARVPIRSAADVIHARKAGRALATDSGFSDAEVTSIVTALSEITRNIVEYAHAGEVLIKQIQRGTRRGLEVLATDEGPGIRDVRAVLEPGNAPSPGAATGLIRAKWLMDTLEISSTPGRGTIVRMVKWLP